MAPTSPTKQLFSSSFILSLSFHPSLSLIFYSFLGCIHKESESNKKRDGARRMKWNSIWKNWMEWNSAAARGAAAHNPAEEQRRPQPLHQQHSSFPLACRSRRKRMSLLRSLPRCAWVAVCWLMGLIRFICLFHSPFHKRNSAQVNPQPTALLSLCFIDWMKCCLFVCSLFAAEPLAVPPPITHHKEKQQTNSSTPTPMQTIRNSSWIAVCLGAPSAVNSPSLHQLAH